MAFNAAKPSINAAPRGSAQAGAQSDAWKAQGFINFYLPSATPGKRRKLGTIPLHDRKSSEAQLREWLEENPDRVKKILGQLELEYRSAEPAEGSGFNLPGDEEEEGEERIPG